MLGLLWLTRIGEKGRDTLTIFFFETCCSSNLSDGDTRPEERGHGEQVETKDSTRRESGVLRKK